MKLIHKKIISVGSGLVISQPFFFMNINPFVDSIILCVFFILYYYVWDKIFEKIEKRDDIKNDNNST